MGLSSKHFSERELRCKDNCGLNNASQRLLDLAEKVRLLIGKPMVVHSACRCEVHNRRVGGSPKSQHLIGAAMDFHVAEVAHIAVRDLILKGHQDGRLSELGGLGLYNWGIHIDVRKGNVVTWDHRKVRRV